jgi:phage-related minor tail protein
MADETSRLVLDVVGRDRGGRKTLTDVAKAADSASDEVKDLDKATDRAGKTLKDTAKEADRLTSEIEKTEKSVKDLAKQIKENPGDSGLFKQLNKEQAQLRRLLRVQDLVNPKEAEQAGQQAGFSLFAGLRKRFGPAQVGVFAKQSLSGIAAAAGGAALAAGAAAGALLMEGVRASIEKGNADALLRAQLGKTLPAAGDVGKLSGKIYADNFGSGFEDVNAALKNVIRQGLVDAKTASKQELTAITEQVLTVASVTEETTDRVAAAAAQMVRTGLARNVTDALDLITTASQQGLDKSGDLLDTLNEYGTQFRKLGLSGPEALGLISQALKNGARDSDIAADALKEFSIRAVDGSKTTTDAFRSIGLDADKMRDAFAAGGDTAKQALDQVLDRLRAVRDPAERARIQVELFGTQAEDLGDALNALDLDTAAREMDGFAGSTERASDALSESAGAKTQAQLRKLKGEIIDLGTSASDTGFKLLGLGAAIFKGSGQTGSEVAKAAEELAKKYKLAAGGATDTKTATDRLDGSLKAQTLDMRQAATAAGGLANALDQITGANVDAKRAESDYQAAVAETVDVNYKHIKTIDLATQRGRDYNAQLLNIRDATVRYAEAIYNQTGSQSQANAIIEKGRTQLYNTARQMGLSKAEARRYVDQILQIPKSWTTRVNVDNRQALRAIAVVRREVKNLKGKTIGIHVSGPGGSGTQIAGAAKGEYITGPGPKGKDSVLRAVAPGEYIVRPEDVDAAGGRAGFEAVLDSLHNTRSTVSRFRAAAGGAAPPVNVNIAASPSANAGDQMLLSWFHQAVRTGRIQLKVSNGRVVVGV